MSARPTLATLVTDLRAAYEKYPEFKHVTGPLFDAARTIVEPRCDALAEALTAYGQHNEGCGYGPGLRCTCGYIDAVRTLLTTPVTCSTCTHPRDMHPDDRCPRAGPMSDESRIAFEKAIDAALHDLLSIRPIVGRPTDAAWLAKRLAPYVTEDRAAERVRCVGIWAHAIHIGEGPPDCDGSSAEWCRPCWDEADAALATPVETEGTP